jgi:hypothetical protein
LLGGAAIAKLAVPRGRAAGVSHTYFFALCAARVVQRRTAVAAGLASLLALPGAARANDVTDIFAKASPNDVVEFLLDKLKKNDTPAPDAGLKVLIGAASPSNPAAADPERFKSAIKGSAYSILLGNYESMRMAKAEEGILQNGNYGATVSVRLDATVRKMAALGVDQKFLFAAEEPGARTSDSAEGGDQDSKLFCIMNFQLPCTSSRTSKCRRGARLFVDSFYLLVARLRGVPFRWKSQKDQYVSTLQHQ